MKFLKCLFGFHDLKWERILTTPPRQFIQTQVAANLGKCKYCNKQIIEYFNKEYNNG
jgi:hypothetical protein